MHNRGHWVIENPISSLVLASSLTAVSRTKTCFYILLLSFPLSIPMLKTKHLLRLNMLLDWPTSCATEGRSKWRHGLACLGPKHQKQSSCFQMMGFIQHLYRIGLGGVIVDPKAIPIFHDIYINILIFFNDVNCCIWGGLRLFRIGISGRRMGLSLNHKRKDHFLETI